MGADNSDVKSLCNRREERIVDEEVKGALLSWALVEASGEDLPNYDEGNGRAGELVI